MFDVAALNAFYEHVSVSGGMPVEQVNAELSELFERPRSETDLNNFRLSKKPWKKLSDEICPVLRFLHANKMTAGHIRFPLDDHAPDCWYWADPNVSPVGIEVTVAQGRARIELNKELVEKGIAGGFIGLPDDAPQVSFDNARARGRVMYSTDQAVSSTKKGILACLSKKDRAKYEGMILVVQSRIRTLPTERWRPMVEEIKCVATALPFKNVYCVGDSDSNTKYFKLK